jgi:hypothetical protein
MARTGMLPQATASIYLFRKEIRLRLLPFLHYSLICCLTGPMWHLRLCKQHPNPQTVCVWTSTNRAIRSESKQWLTRICNRSGVTNNQPHLITPLANRSVKTD